jgi:hypothetical protein
MNKLVRLAGVAGVVAGVAVGGTAAKAETINIFAWTDANLPILLGSGGPGSFSLASGTIFGGATFNTVNGTAGAPGDLNLAQTISAGITAPLASPIHIAVEVAGLAAPFVTGSLIFDSGLGTTSITGNLSVTESTHLGSVCTSLPAVLGTCAARAANIQLATMTFNGPTGSNSIDFFTAGNTGASYTVFDEFVFTGGAGCSPLPAGTPCSSNVNISLRAAVPGPIAGAGLPGLLAALAGLVGLARRRRNRQGGGELAAT